MNLVTLQSDLPLGSVYSRWHVGFYGAGMGWEGVWGGGLVKRVCGGCRVHMHVTHSDWLVDVSTTGPAPLNH